MQRAAVPVLLLALGLGPLAGCSGSDETSATPAAPRAPATSGASGSAHAATGIRLSKPEATVLAPEGWTRGRQLSSDEEAAEDPDSISFLTLSEIEAFGATLGADELGRTRIESSVLPRSLTVLPVAELDGVPVYHVAGFVSAERYLEEYGAIRNDRIVSLQLSFDREVSPADRRAVVDQVLPTFRWR